MKIPPNMKSILLRGINSNNRPNNRFNSNEYDNPSYKTVKPSSYNEKPFTKANLHKLLKELIVEGHESEDASIVSENAINNNESTLLVNLKIATKLNLRDVRKSLSNPIKSNPHPFPLSGKNISYKTVVNVNGKIYR